MQRNVQTGWIGSVVCTKHPGIDARFWQWLNFGVYDIIFLLNGAAISNMVFEERGNEMFRKEIDIQNKTGLHARPASELVELCNKFESEVILITKDGEELDGKSIISVLSGGVYQGAKVILQAEGLDEETAGAQVANFLENLPD